MKRRLSKKQETLAKRYLNEHSEIVDNAICNRFRLLNTFAPIESYTRKPLLLKSKIELHHMPPTVEFIYREFARSLCMNEQFRDCVHIEVNESHAGTIADLQGSTEYIMSIEVLPFVKKV